MFSQVSCVTDTTLQCGYALRSTDFISTSPCSVPSGGELWGCWSAEAVAVCAVLQAFLFHTFTVQKTVGWWGGEAW